MEASSQGSTVPGAGTTVTSDIFSSTKVRNTRSWLPFQAAGIVAPEA